MSSTKPTWPPLPDKIKIGIFRFPFDMKEMSTSVDWVIRACHYLGNHERVVAVATESIADTPVDMSRNRALKRAQELGLNFAVFIDADMWPDYGYVSNGCVETEEHAQFLPHALEFALAHDGPCVIGAPYCCAPPEERVLVKKWAVTETDDPSMRAQIKSLGRDEVIDKRGFEEVAALATGMLFIDLRALAVLPQPYFSYQFKDAAQTEKASTEDVVFTRDLHCLGVPQYCLWSAWAGHWKNKMVSKPACIPIGLVPKAMRDVVRRDFNTQLQKQYGDRIARAEYLEKRVVELEGTLKLMAGKD